MTLYRKLYLIPCLALLIAALACNAPTAPSPESETATALFATALTSVAGTTGTPATGATNSTTQIANTPTNPPANSTATNTAAPQQCVVTAKTAVNVRNGPTTFHPILRILAEGATGVVTGRNNDTTWWQIDGNGWVSAPYVTTSGPCTGINVASYPPAPPTNTSAPTATYTATVTNTPTATATVTGTVTVTATYTSSPAPVDFNISYTGNKWNCGTNVFATFSMTNTGTSTLEYAAIDAEAPAGTDVGSSAPNANFPFRGNATQTLPGCAQPGFGQLGPTSGGYIYVDLGVAGATGSGKATVTACTADSGGGTCVTKSITFTW